MRSRVTLYVIVAVVAAVALVVGVVAVAGAGSAADLPAISAPELMTKMAQADDTVTSVSGEISWTNGLFGDVDTAVDMAQLPAQSPLTSSGSGRVWMSDAGMRVESQGSGGDQVAGVSTASRTAWTYDSANDTARQWTLTGEAPARTPETSPSAMTPAAITTFLQRLAPFATVDVAGQSTVAGRPVYLLRMTPVADDTALGAVQAAVDGETMLPLSLEVFAKGGAAAVLRFGFDSVSYQPVDPGLFEFTPPAGADVTTEELDPASSSGGCVRGTLTGRLRRTRARPVRRTARRWLAVLCSPWSRRSSWSTTRSPRRRATRHAPSGGRTCSTTACR